MAKTKPTFAKLKLSSEVAPVEIEWGDQIIEVKQYLPIQDKLTMISEIINAAADENRFANWGKIEMFKQLYIVYYYTNITFTDKQKEDPVKLYDALVGSGLCAKIEEAIPHTEYWFVDDNLTCLVKDIYKYQYSAYGIMDAMNTDYNNLSFDIEKLTKELGNRENAQFLDEVLTKLG